MVIIMKHFFILVLTTILLSASAHGQVPHKSSSPFFTKDQKILLDGKPRFLVGMFVYDNIKNADEAKEVADAGFNFLIPLPAAGTESDYKPTLDLCQSNGMKAGLFLPWDNLTTSGDPELRRSKILAMVEQYKNHPALGLWVGPDEPIWQFWIRADLEKLLPDAEATRTVPTEQRASFESMCARARDLYARALWKQGEEAAAKAWSLTGQKPKVQGFAMSDAARLSLECGQIMKRNCEAIRKADPAHGIYLNHAPRNSIASMKQYNEGFDMAGCDIYPVPVSRNPGHSDLPDITLTSVGAYTDRMRAALPDKPVIMILQGFGWKNLHAVYTKEQTEKDPELGRLPNLRETRFMAFDVIAHGASGIVYWGENIRDKPQLWKDMLTVTRQLKALEPALIAPEIGRKLKSRCEEIAASWDGQGPRVLLRKSGGDYVLIAVNECASPVHFHISGLPKEMEGKTLYRMGSEESVTVRNGSIQDGIYGSDAFVYATSRRFEPSQKIK